MEMEMDLCFVDYKRTYGGGAKHLQRVRTGEETTIVKEFLKRKTTKERGWPRLPRHARTSEGGSRSGNSRPPWMFKGSKSGDEEEEVVERSVLRVQQ
ncbi:hypothetical protein V6N12_026208 [Hibiscus sabdariffa]|uniref:Uncharacterized protein n=1 Tax=Hibiscus sabdariffa TaxID=183260 RepID=A0ABR2DS60_9ROSI